MLRLPWRRRHGGATVFCVFRYPDAIESRWLAQLPKPGTRVRSPTGAVWIVDEVLQSGRKTYTVYCVARKAYVERLRGSGTGERDLGAELLEAARHASEAVSERRRRRRLRSFLP